MCFFPWWIRQLSQPDSRASLQEGESIFITYISKSQNLGLMRKKLPIEQNFLIAVFLSRVSSNLGRVCNQAFSSRI